MTAGPVEQEQKPVACERCGAEFIVASNLTSHVCAVMADRSGAFHADGVVIDHGFEPWQHRDDPWRRP